MVIATVGLLVAARVTSYVLKHCAFQSCLYFTNVYLPPKVLPYFNFNHFVARQVPFIKLFHKHVYASMYATIGSIFCQNSLVPTKLLLLYMVYRSLLLQIWNATKNFGLV